MKDSRDKIYSALFSLLSGNVSYEGEDILICDTVPQSAGNDYIYLADLNLSEASVNDRFMQNGYINIQVVVKHQQDSYSNKKLDNIAGQVKNLIKPTVTSTLTLSPDFSNVFLYLENELTDYSLQQVDRLTRRILRFRMEVEEL